MNHITNVLDCVASLESTYEILKNISAERELLTETEYKFVNLSINSSMSLIGANSASIVPSLESDNYYVSHSVTASMESLTDGIKAGLKSAAKALMNMLKRIGEFLVNLKTKIANAKIKIQTFYRSIKDGHEYEVHVVSDHILLPDVLKSTNERITFLENIFRSNLSETSDVGALDKAQEELDKVLESKGTKTFDANTKHSKYSGNIVRNFADSMLKNIKRLEDLNASVKIDAANKRMATFAISGTPDADALTKLSKFGILMKSSSMILKSLQETLASVKVKVITKEGIAVDITNESITQKI